MKRFLIGLTAVAFAIIISFAFTTPAKSKNSLTQYWFEVSNTVGISDYTSATLSFPSSVPPTSASFGCTADNITLCSLAFPGYILDGGVYKPSTSPNGGTLIEQANYDDRVDEETKD